MRFDYTYLTYVLLPVPEGVNISRVKSTSELMLNLVIAECAIIDLPIGEVAVSYITNLTLVSGRCHLVSSLHRGWLACVDLISFYSAGHRQ